MSGSAVPQQLVQLQQHPDRQAVAQYPFGQMRGIQRAVRRRKQHCAFLGQPMLRQDLLCPLVIVFIAQHEFDFVMLGQQRQIFSTVLFGFTGRGSLDVHHAHHARIHLADIQCAAGFQRHLVARIA